MKNTNRITHECSKWKQSYKGEMCILLNSKLKFIFIILVEVIYKSTKDLAMWLEDDPSHLYFVLSADNG